MSTLSEILQKNENWLMERILHYSKDFGFTRYTSTLQEAWRLSIQGLTKSISASYNESEVPPPITLKKESSALTEFGVIEAKLHRKRGVTLTMFLSLMKYYKESYLDLIDWKLDREDKKRDNYRAYIRRCFDLIEIAFCDEWAKVEDQSLLDELQDSNRLLTNEKNAYLTVFESLSDPVIMVGSSRQIVNINHAAAKLIEGNSAVPGEKYYQSYIQIPEIQDTRVEHKLDDLFPWLPKELLDHPSKECRFNKIEFEANIHGETRHFLATIGNMLDVSEKFTSQVITLQDQTDKIEAYKLLTDEVTVKNKLFSIIAHDLRSPFHAVLFLTNNLYKKIDTMSVEKRDQTLKDMRDSLKKIYRLIENLLEWSKTQLEKYSLNYSDHNLHELAEEAVGVLSEQAKNKSITILNQIPKEFICHADYNMILAVVRNLISNAIKFSHPGGSIEILSMIKRGKIEVCIRDTGIGMSEHIKDNIYSSNEDTQREGTNHEQGTGLGLLLCKEFIEIHKGKIWILSEEQKGTSICFSLPKK